MDNAYDAQGAYVRHGNEVFLWRRGPILLGPPPRRRKPYLVLEPWEFSYTSGPGATGITALGFISISAMIELPEGAKLTLDALHILAKFDVDVKPMRDGRSRLSEETLLAIFPRGNYNPTWGPSSAEAAR